MATWRGGAGLAVVLLCASPASQAEELDLILRASAGYSDNVNRTSSDEQSSNIYAPGLDIDFKELTRRLDATVTGNLDYLTYTAHGLDNQLVGNFYGNVSYGFVPETFVWNVQESYGQGRGDLAQPMSPGNTDGINYFSTGPQVTLRFSDRMFLTANAQYANAWYQGQDTDSNQYGGGVSLGRSLSQATNVQASVQYQKIDYLDSSAGPDVDMWQYFLAYTAKSPRSSLTANAGYRSFDDGIETRGGPLIRLNLSRQLSGYTTVFVLAGDEYNDSAGQLNGNLSVPGNPGVTNGYSNGEIFVDTYGGGGFTFSRLRTRFGATATYHDQNYVQSSDNDLHRWDVNGYVERDLNRAWSAGFDFWYYHEDYTNVSSSNAEANYSLYVNWKFARTVGLSVEWNHWQSTASDQPDANENQYWLRLNWHPIHRAGRSAIGTPAELDAPPPPGS